MVNKDVNLMRLWIPFLILSTVVLLLAPDANAQEYAGRGGWGARESVFRVRCRLATPVGQRDIDLGTGFGHKSGNVLSANHVIDPCLKEKGSLQLVAPGGRISTAAVIVQDAAIDLVLLKPDFGFFKNSLSLPIATNTSMTMGSQVSSWGFPTGYSGNLPLLTVGHLAGVSEDPNDTSIKRWVVNAAINKGNSGGPLLETETPAVIGMVIEKYSPLMPGTRSKLQGLLTSGGPEAKVLAQAMIDIAERAQLVIGQSVLVTDLQAFLRRAGAEP
jgi:S1-C subfamily serine protease